MRRIGPIFSTVFGVKSVVRLKCGSVRIGMETQWNRNGNVVSGRSSILRPDAAHRPDFFKRFWGQIRGSPQVRIGTDRHGNRTESQWKCCFRSQLHFEARCGASARFFPRFLGSNPWFASGTDRHGFVWKRNGIATEKSFQVAAPI
jgi:hypothetical protein